MVDVHVQRLLQTQGVFKELMDGGLEVDYQAIKRFILHEGFIDPQDIKALSKAVGTQVGAHLEQWLLAEVYPKNEEN